MNRKKLLAIGCIVLLLGVIAKLDADNKARAFFDDRAELAAIFVDEAAKLKLSQLVGTGDDEKAAEERALCKTAKNLQNKARQAADLLRSPGGFLSQTYKEAANRAQLPVDSRELGRYVGICNHYVLDTERRSEVEAIRNSNEYKAALTFDKSACGGRDSCLLEVNYLRLTGPYEKIIAVNQKYVDTYKATVCPMQPGHEAVCKGVIKFEEALVEDARDYVSALKTSNTGQLIRSGNYEKGKAAFAELTGDVQRIDPAYVDINDYYKKQLQYLEVQIQQAARKL